LNEKVLSFALDQMGKKVGNGQCTMLAVEALAFAGASPSLGYEFGREIPQSEMKPGDILQFHTAKFVTRNSWQLMGAPHHTAIVHRVRGSKVAILHQNVGNDKTVKKGAFDFKNLTMGSVKVFRPEERSNVSDSSRPIREILEPPSRLKTNGKVLSFALKQMGRKIGNGQCTELAVEALTFARARPPKGYHFGQEIPKSQIVPGDIVQFHTAFFVDGNSWQQMGAPRHTAIAYEVRGSVITILHQNFGNDKSVKKGVFNFKNLTKGTVKVFRPVPKSGRRR